MSSTSIPSIVKHNINSERENKEENYDELGEIFLEKFIALNPLYYIDEEEENEIYHPGFHEDYSESNIKNSQ